jgi:hypothetical protein
MTDTQRAASEMMLVSQAIDNSVAQLDFSAMAGKPVFLDTQYLDGTVDKGYLISSLRQQLLAQGALLQEERQKSLYVVEPRAGAVGTDKHSLLVGTPAITLPSLSMIPITSIPEIALMKQTDQKGVAKVAVFAYNRLTGRALWQSGLVDSESTLKDTWVFGAGPFSRGTVRKETELAGEKLPKLPIPFVASKDEPAPPPPTLPTNLHQPHTWANANTPPPPQPVPFPLLGLTGPAATADRAVMHFAPLTPPAAEPPVVPASAPVVPAGLPVPTVPYASPPTLSPPPGTVQVPPYPLPRLN